jgi:hypothetical protein
MCVDIMQQQLHLALAVPTASSALIMYVPPPSMYPFLLLSRLGFSPHDLFDCSIKINLTDL